MQSIIIDSYMLPHNMFSTNALYLILVTAFILQIKKGYIILMITEQKY